MYYDNVQYNSHRFEYVRVLLLQEPHLLQLVPGKAVTYIIMQFSWKQLPLFSSRARIRYNRLWLTLTRSDKRDLNIRNITAQRGSHK